MPDAYAELMELQKTEQIDGIAFGYWDDRAVAPVPSSVACPVPDERRGVVLSFADAAPFLKGWSFDNDFGAGDCYAVYIWTTELASGNKKVWFVDEYDTSTCLRCLPGLPTGGVPSMNGNG